MSDLLSTTAIPSEDGSTITKAMKEFNAKIEAVAMTATDADRAEAIRLTVNGQAPRWVTISPVVAAVIYTAHNKVNRDFTISKALGFVEIMQRGDYKRHHQGIAFYPDGSLADGQHRMAACALSGVAMVILVSNDFDKDSIDAIDRSKSRTAAEALQMIGIADARIKATVAKITLGYMHEHDHKQKPFLDDAKIERWVQHNEQVLQKAIAIGRSSIRNVSQPAMSEALATEVATLMLLGGWSVDRVMGFVASVQQGIATYAEAPTVELSRKLVRAAFAEKKKDQLSTREKLALSLKAASLWDRTMSVARLNWNASKEELPDYRPTPVETFVAAE